MNNRNGGKILIECLRALGATHSFGVPGESYLAVLDALHDTKGELDFTLCRNEGGASFMAAAYGKLTGTPGLCFVTRGPGATNASIGVHTAKQDSVPMLLFIGQIGKDMTDREAFQEVDYRAYFGTVAKWATQIDNVDRIPEVVSRAWTTAMSGRPGPVVIALPEDMLTDTSVVPALSKAVKITEPSPSTQAMDEIHAKLTLAKKPLIISGGNGWFDNGRLDLQKFAEVANIPVVAAFRFQDQFDNNSHCYAGEAGVGMTAATKELIKSSDLILALNVRLGEMSTDGYSLIDIPFPKQELIHVHSTSSELGRVYVPEIAVQSGPNAFASALLAAEISGGWDQWRAEARKGYEDSFEVPAQPSPVDMSEVMSYLRGRLPKDAILTNGAGNFTIWPGKFFKYGPDHRLLAPQSGAMGYGLPASVAAKVAYPERTVVCFAGDGDFQMNYQELGTAMQAGAQPIVLILNNGIYGTIRMHQERNYPERVSGTTLQNPDFVALAKAYDFYAEYIERTEDFPAAFEKAMSSKTGAVLELNISPEALTPRQTLSEMRAVAKGKLS